MKQDSLKSELLNLKNYLLSINPPLIDNTERKIISHTLVGMIMTIHNLINTGAYDTTNNTELYELINETRDLSLHYGYFDDYANIISKTKSITDLIKDKDIEYFASYLESLKPLDKSEYYHINNSSNIIISKDNNLLKIENLHTKELLYLDLKDVITLKNKVINKDSYLIRKDITPLLFYKNDTNITEKITYNELKETSFYNALNLETCPIIDINATINELISSLKDNAYKNIIISYQYNNKIIKFPLHKILKNYLKNNEIEERIVLGKYSLIDYDKSKSHLLNPIKNINIEKMVSSLSLKDSFFIELFLKNYNLINSDNDYSNQSMLLNLYEISLSRLSEEFINSDHTKQFSLVYYEYKKIRKELAHSAITDSNEKKIILNDMKEHTDELYSILNQIYKTYLTRLSRNPLNKLSISKSMEKNKPIIHNKTSQYFLINHLKEFKIIEDKKYLKLNDDNIYLEIDRSLLLYNYTNNDINQCLIPFDQVKTVSIINNKISKYALNLDNANIVKFDANVDSLLQALDFLRSHPHYQDKNNSFPVITFFDSNNKAIFSENLINLLYRKYALKIVPDNLINCSDLIIPKNLNEPLILINKDKTIIAKIYLARLDKYNNLKQILINNVERNIDYGKLLAKDLKTNEIISNKKEGR